MWTYGSSWWCDLSLQVANSCVTAAILIANILTDVVDPALEISQGKVVSCDVFRDIIKLHENKQWQSDPSRLVFFTGSIWYLSFCFGWYRSEKCNLERHCKTTGSSSSNSDEFIITPPICFSFLKQIRGDWRRAPWPVRQLQGCCKIKC